MDTRHLKYFITIAQKGNMTKAADELYVSQSSLSQYLAKLEQELGVPLFERTHSCLVLTPAGKLYVDAAKKIIRIKDNLYQQIKSVHNRSHINLGITSLLGLRMLTKVIPVFKEQYPEATIEITEGNIGTLLTMIKEESIDCAVMAIADKNTLTDSAIRVLGEEEILLAVPDKHPFTKFWNKENVLWKVIFQNMGNDNFLLSKKGSTLRQRIDSIFDEYNFVPKTMFETNSIQTMRAMVAMGIGITFLGSSCREFMGGIRYYSFEPKATRYFIYMERKNWNTHDTEEYLKSLIFSYFENQDVKKMLHK